eukprot:gene40643-49553_t
MEESGDFSDEGLDEFEESVEDKRKPAQHNNKNQTYKDKPYDEAYEISQDLSMAESFDAREKVHAKQERERKLRNDKYDEAVEVSQSLDNVNLGAIQSGAKPVGNASQNSRPDAKGTGGSRMDEKEAKLTTPGNPSGTLEASKSQSLINRPFDEAFEFSQSNSDESVETTQHKPKPSGKPAPLQANATANPASKPSAAAQHSNNNATSVTMNAMVRESTKKSADPA